MEQGIPFERGTSDLTFQFGHTDCGDFKFDVDDPGDLKLELFYGEGHRFEFETYERAGHWVKLGPPVLARRAYNEDFYVITSATFRNTQDPSITQDLSIVFKLRWSTDTVLQLDEERIAVGVGEDLQIDASQAEVINSEVGPGSLKWTWHCPKGFDCSQIDLESQELRISSSQLSSLGEIMFLKEYLFIVQVGSGYGLPSGQPFVERVLGVTWLGPPDSVAIQSTDLNSI